MGTKNNIKILMIPDYSEVNAYQRKLRDELENQGATVILSSSIGYFAVLSAIRKHGLPDVVHLHWLQSYVISKNHPIKTIAGGFRILFEIFILKLAGVTIVWTVHNVLQHRRRTPRLEKLIKHVIVRLCDSIIVHCSVARETIIQAYHLPQEMTKKIYVIPHGNYIDAYPNEQTQTKARTTIEEFNDSDIIYLFFGQIRPYKNIPKLIDDFKKIDDSNIRLLIVGNPWDEKEAEKVRRLSQSDSRIQTIFEFIPDDKIQLYMNAADVVVLPFEKILTSGSALLAMSFGKALIAPNIGCVGELLDPDGGFGYEPENDEGLLRAIEQASNADLESLGKYNYQKAKQFNWESIASQTYEIYVHE